MANEFPSPDQRILRGVAASLVWQPVDSDGTAADPGAAVTVDVARADGTVVATAAATTGTGSEPRAYALSAANNGLLDHLAVTWKVGGVATASTMVDVVGGYYASIADIRAAQPSLTDGSYPDEVVLRARWETEIEFEAACRVAFVPRYARGRYSGRGLPVLPLAQPMLRSVRSVRYYSDATNYTSETAPNVAAISADEGGIARFVNDVSVFPSGRANVVVEVEHGFDRPPADVRQAFFARVRSRLNMAKSGIPDRAVTYTTTEGGTFGIATPSASWWETGLPEVDTVLRRYRDRFAPVLGIA